MPTGIPIAIIGAGYWGTNLARVFSQTQGICLKALCDSQAERLSVLSSLHPELLVTTSWQKICEDTTIRAVVLATPPATHFSLAREALLAGKHVWVEKPFALRYADGCELVALAAQQRRTLFVDETFLYDPLLQRAREILVSGVLGRIHHVSFVRTGMGRIRRDSNVWWNSAPHDLSILRYLLDISVIRLSVSGQTIVQPHIEDTAFASLELANHCSAHIYVSWLSPEKKASLTIVGEHGIVSYEGRFEQRQLTQYAYRLKSTPMNEDVTRENVIPIDTHSIVETRAGDGIEPLALACVAFRDHMVGRSAVPSTGEHALTSLAVLEAGAQSLAQQGTWVTIARQE